MHDEDEDEDDDLVGDRGVRRAFFFSRASGCMTENNTIVAIGDRKDVTHGLEKKSVSSLLPLPGWRLPLLRQ